MADATIMKLGYTGTVPVVNMMPTGAEVNGAGYLHFLYGQGAYLSCTLGTAIPPSRVKAVLKAIGACPTQPSASGSGKPYHVLNVAPWPAGQGGDLLAGAVRVCSFVVDPEWSPVSGDEPLSAQIGDDEDPDDDSDDDA